MITASRKVPPTPATVPTVETEKLGCMVSYPKVKDEAEGKGEENVVLDVVLKCSGTFSCVVTSILGIRTLLLL